MSTASLGVLVETCKRLAADLEARIRHAADPIYEDRRKAQTLIKLGRRLVEAITAPMSIVITVNAD